MDTVISLTVFFMKKMTKLIKISVLGAILLLTGCKAWNSVWGNDSVDYSQAKELPPLKFPAGSLAVSKRYDIPDIPGNKDQIINNPVPPDYETQ